MSDLWRTLLEIGWRDLLFVASLCLVVFGLIGLGVEAEHRWLLGQKKEESERT